MNFTLLPRVNPCLQTSQANLAKQQLNFSPPGSQAGSQVGHELRGDASTERQCIQFRTSELPICWTSTFCELLCYVKKVRLGIGLGGARGTFLSVHKLVKNWPSLRYFSRVLLDGIKCQRFVNFTKYNWVPHDTLVEAPIHRTHTCETYVIDFTTILQSPVCRTSTSKRCELHKHTLLCILRTSCITFHCNTSWRTSPKTPELLNFSICLRAWQLQH